MKGGPVTKEVRLRMTIGDHHEIISLDIANIGDNDVILGIPWLKKHNPHIIWSTHKISFPEEASRKGNPLLKESSKKTMVINKVKGPEPGKLPLQYQDFHDVFQEKDLEKLPPHWPYNLTIDLLKDEHGNDVLPKPSWIYPINQEELKALKQYVDSNLAKGFIHPSKAP